MSEGLSVFAIFPINPRRFFEAWLDEAEHTAFTNFEAKIEPFVGGKFTASSGYISGTTTILEPYSRIVQSWRTTDFPPESPDSELEILIQPVDVGCQVILNHSNLPDGSADDYESGWEDYYFAPMQGYFARENGLID
jgi:activator of HSP90 ATPase